MKTIKYLFVSVLLFTLVLSAQAQNVKNKVVHQTLDECKKCHLCETPTKKNPCLRTCPRNSMIPVHYSADEGPDVIIMDILTDMYVPVVFSHQLHAQMADMSGGCETCHHYNPPGDIMTCQECHQVSPQRADLSMPALKGAYHRQCLGCHREWSHTTKCAVCHALKSKTAEMTETQDKTDIIGSSHPPIPEPDKIVYETSHDKGKLVTFFHRQHIHLYGQGCVSCHKKENCKKCHDLSKKSLAEQVATGDYIKVHKSEEDHHKACFDCHADNKCGFCHVNKEKASFDHFARSGWKLKTYHGSLSCQKCHHKKGIFEGLKSNCSACHKGWDVDSFNHKITGLILDENHQDNDCADCHMDNEYAKTPTCDNCHEDDISFPAKKPGRLIN